MTSIDRARQALEVLRSRSSGTLTPASAPLQSPTQSNPSADLVASQSIRPGVLSRIRAIPRNDPDRTRKAIRAFLDAVWTAEFGPQVVNSTEYHDMLDSVVALISDEIVLRQQFLGTLRQIEAGQ